jgi:flagellar M-ring protein FliF
MDFLNKSLAQVSELFRSMTPGARITSGLLLAVVVVSLGYLFKQGAAGPDAFLFGGQALSDAELIRIEGALGQGSLIWAREGNRIRVPIGQQAAAVAAIADADALPKSSSTILENAVNQSGAFASNAEKKERYKIGVQQTLQEIVREMDWVEDAVVLYDEHQPRGLSLSKQVTASVSVRPALGESLDPVRAKTLQKLIAHAVVGLKPEDVAVINLGGGGAFGSEGAMTPEMFDDEYQKTRVAFEMQKRQTIMDALKDIPGVRVAVNVELNDTVEQTTHNLKPDKTGIAVTRETTSEESDTQTIADQGGRPGVVVQGPNRQGGAAPQQRQKQNEKSSNTTDIENIVPVEQSQTVKRGYTPKEMWAIVTIPSSYVETVWRQRNPTVTDPPKPQDLEFVKGEIRTTVENIVDPLLLLQALKVENTYKHVRVEFLETLPVPAIEPPSTTSQALAWTGRYWSTLAMLGVAVFSLMVLRSVVKGGPPNTGTNTEVAGPKLSLQTDNPPSAVDEQQQEAGEKRPRLRLKKGSSLKDDLVEIVHEDPDAAAEILRSWISKAS